MFNQKVSRIEFKIQNWKPKVPLNKFLFHGFESSLLLSFAIWHKKRWYNFLGKLVQAINNCLLGWVITCIFLPLFWKYY